MKLLLVILVAIASTLALAEQRKGFRYCPKEPKPKDYPCVVMGPQYHIVARTEIPKDSELEQLRRENQQLKQAIQLLEQQIVEPKEKLE